MEKHPLHIKNPELQTSAPVQRAVVRKQRREGEKVPNDPGPRIEAYMDRLEDIFLNTDPETRRRNIEMFREKIHESLIIKKENFPESYFELQQRIARERGQAVEEITEEVREQMMDVVIEDQRASLNNWIDYLTSPDAVYPAWFKYYVWNQIIKLSQFDKERGEFKKRTDTTIAPYPDIYREPLAQIADLYEKIKDDNKDSEARREFDKKFPALYAELISKSLAASLENRESIEGQWVKYEQGDMGQAEKLFQSLEGKGTGWCTAGLSTASAQIEDGDFYVYYTYDEHNDPTQPRLAIRMDGDKEIGEVRGILPHQEVEPVMQEVLDAKLNEFGSEAEMYKKKSSDMRMLTSLEKKQEQGLPFTKEELVFLYEVNSKIEGFGYQRDPRIKELRNARYSEELEGDMLLIFDCTKDEIAYIPSEINAMTKAYVGPLQPGIFEKLPDKLEHVYTSFPGQKIRRENVEIGGKNAEQLILELETVGIKISNYDRAEDMLRSPNFIVGNREEVTLVKLTVADLGFPRTATTDQIYSRAEKLGLELCPPDSGPAYFLQHKDKSLDESSGWKFIMKPIVGRYDAFDMFYLEYEDDAPMLRSGMAEPITVWSSSAEFVFRLRKT